MPARADHPCTVQLVPTDGSCEPEIGVIAGCPTLQADLAYGAGVLADGGTGSGGPAFEHTAVDFLEQCVHAASGFEDLGDPALSMEGLVQNDASAFRLEVDGEHTEERTGNQLTGYSSYAAATVDSSAATPDPDGCIELFVDVTPSLGVSDTTQNFSGSQLGVTIFDYHFDVLYELAWNAGFDTSLQNRTTLIDHGCPPGGAPDVTTHDGVHLAGAFPFRFPVQDADDGIFVRFALGLNNRGSPSVDSAGTLLLGAIDGQGRIELGSGRVLSAPEPGASALASVAIAAIAGAARARRLPTRWPARDALRPAHRSHDPPSA